MNQRPRAPGFAHTALAVVLLLLLAGVALTVRQPPPPSIAEFAPQAVEQITDSPHDQSGKVSGSAGADGSESPVESPAALADTIDVPRVRRCVGEPPRQIEDPQSPPCVPYWSGDNGGATYRGVTRNDIRIGANVNPQAEKVLEGFFNSRFEFYGRHVDLLPMGVDNDCAIQQSQAVAMDEERHAFGALDMNHAGSNCFYMELARRGLLSINGSALITESDMRELHPYMWQYEMGRDELFDGVGAMICGRVAHRPATHTSDPLLLGRTRTFGVIVHDGGPAIPVYTDPLINRLQRCGVKPDPIIQYYPGESSFAGIQSDSEQAVLQMKQKNVTSIICICAIFTETTLGATATHNGYFPEWLTSTYGGNDDNLAIKAFWSDPQQRIHMYGVSSHNRHLNVADEPYYWAMTYVDPTIQPVDVANLWMQYRAMLLLASGIQLAGPRLTPETFARGLQRGRFPNPVHPNVPARVGFDQSVSDVTPTRGDHGMTNDLTEYWWSETERGPQGYPNDGTVGTLCFVDVGARRDIRRWPSTPDPFFSGACSSGA